MTKEQKFSDALAVQVERRIFLVRGQKVMLDTDLAELYRVPTKSLNLAVKRNADRFPADFMFELTDDEAAGLRFHFETSKRGRGGRRYLPYAFTEQGVAILFQRPAESAGRTGQYRHHAHICALARDAPLECGTCPQAGRARKQIRRPV